jgi:hypothetical protein
VAKQETGIRLADPRCAFKAHGDEPRIEQIWRLIAAHRRAVPAGCGGERFNLVWQPYMVII